MVKHKSADRYVRRPN